MDDVGLRASKGVFAWPISAREPNYKDVGTHSDRLLLVGYEMG